MPTILCEVTPANRCSNTNTVSRVREVSVAAGTVEIWRADLDADAICLSHLLSPEELTQSARFHEEVHRRRYIQAHGLLRLLISRYTAVVPGFIRFSTNAFGKPFLKNEQNALGLHFNMSHSGGMAAYAFSLDCNVGVDIEHVRDDNDLIALAQRYFAPEEHELLNGLPASSRMQHFFQLWTRKEAIMKAKGTGLSLELMRKPSLSANAFAPDAAGSGGAAPAINECGILDHDTSGDITVLDLEFFRGYAGAVALESVSDMRAMRLAYRDWTWG